MKSFLNVILILLSLSCLSQEISEKTIDDLDSFLQIQIENGSYVGCHITIVQKDTILLAKGYGKTNVQNGFVPNENTLYRMASMSKPVASVAVLKVCEDYAIDLDSPVSTHFNLVPDKAVTIRQLLSQTSGWGDWWNAEHLEQSYKKVTTKGYDTMAQFVQDYLQLPQIAPPGTSWHYGYSMEILAIWLEKVTSQKFTTYVESNIFNPLKMDDSSYVFPDNEQCAFYHEKNSAEQWEIKKAPTLNYFPGSGALISSASDYLKFCTLLKNKGTLNENRIVSEKMIQEMTDVVIGNDGTIIPWQNGYGFALGVSVRVNNEIAEMKGTLGDFGWLGYLGTSFWIDPEREIVGIVLSQRPYDGYKLTHDVREIIYQQ